jgi:predicted O-methyltransferase YrrM
MLGPFNYGITALFLVLIIIVFLVFRWRWSHSKEPFDTPASLPQENVTEGYTTEAQRRHIQALIQQYAPNAKRILEIGFNAGHSADNFLKMNKDIQVVSFDLGEHDYGKPAKAYIDATYPGRHTLILGDSTKTIPKYASSAPFDVIFIDGGHAYEVARDDLENCRRLGHSQTLLLMDDTVRTRPEWVRGHNEGPNRAWLECLTKNKVREFGFVDYTDGRGMSWGKYT